MKRDRACVLLPSGALRSMRELTGAPTGDVQGQAAKLARIVAYRIAARNRVIEQREITSRELVCRIRILRRRSTSRGSAPCCARPCPSSRLRPRDAVFGRADQKESGTMRINFRALGIAADGCMIALFLYVMLALPGVLSDRDSIVALTVMQRHQHSGMAAPSGLAEQREAMRGNSPQFQQKGD
jgi:hypothetical protein